MGITSGGFTLNPTTRRYAQTVTLRNGSAGTITGPISLVLDSLSSNATLLNARGHTVVTVPSGSPYVNANTNLAPGASISIGLQFSNPSHTAITYQARVLAGSARGKEATMRESSRARNASMGLAPHEEAKAI